MSTTTVPVTGRVTVRLLGPPAIERDGRPAPVDTRKAIALLAYLVASGRPQSRDHLATLLWPHADQTRSRSALRRTLSALNAALGGAGLRIERESLAFVGGGVDVDLDTFRTAAQTDDADGWRRAADLYGGDFLAGFVLKDSPDFDEWQLAIADDARRELSGVLERLIDSSDGAEAAIGYAKRWVELDVLHEPAHRALMRAYISRGDRAAALRQYRECVATLERELGVEPLESTTELYESIRESRPAREIDPPRPTAARPSMLPLVGRDEELRAMRDAYAQITDDGHLIVVGGEPGIGKTRLVDEFVAHVRSHDAAVLEARCHPEEEVLAFGTVIELLRTIPRSKLGSVVPDALAEAARLVPSLGDASDAPAALDSPAARRRLFEGIADVLTSACRGDAPGVVFVDDVQWTDGSSLDVLRFLINRLRGRRMVVVLAWRTEEVPPAHPLRRTLADANRLRLATPITLERLTVDDVRTLAGDAQELTDTLYVETAGVPFFIVEYLHSGSRGALPSGVRDLLASRVGAVGKGAAQILAAAAVIGRAFDPRAVREASGRNEAEITSALEELAEAGLVVESDDRYDFSHPKLREYVYGDLTLVRRRLLHGRTAKAFARQSRRAPELAALAALHYERAGDEEAAAGLYEAAGDHAAGVYANAEALAHYRSALALGGSSGARLHEVIGDLLTLDGRYADAIASYEKAAALGADLGEVGVKLGTVHHRLGDWESAEAHYLEATDALSSGAGTARVLAERSLNAHRADRTQAANDLASEALAQAALEDDPAAMRLAHNVAGILASRRGDVAVAREHLGASLDIAESLADPAATAAALNNLALALRAEGETRLALGQTEQALALCRRIGDRHREAAVLSNMADLLRDAGRGDEALDRLKESAAILADIDVPGQAHPEIWKLTEW